MVFCCDILNPNPTAAEMAYVYIQVGVIQKRKTLVALKDG